jgi:hypothetical protein
LNNKIISKLPKASKNPLSPIDKLYEYIKDEPLGIVVRHLLNAIVDKYVDNYKGIEDYFIEETKVISSKTD